MKRAHLLSRAASNCLLQAANACLLQAATACFLVCAASALVAAQTRAVETPVSMPAVVTHVSMPVVVTHVPAGLPPTHARSTRQVGTTAERAAAATADEDFELNIDLRRISESDFHAETEVEAGDARGLHLKVGVALRASDIEVLLRNVRGHVRFRATLEPVLRLLDARRVAVRPTQPAPPATSP